MADHRRSLDRYLLSMRRVTFSGLLALSFSGLSAQKQAEIDYSIYLTPAFNEAQMKFVREALLANDPACSIWPDAPSQRVVVRTTVPVNEAALAQHIAPTGLQVMSVDLILPSDPRERKTMIMASFGFPQYQDTGNPEQDQNNYLTAKSAWVDADPARYEDLIRALNTGLIDAR